MKSLIIAAFIIFGQTAFAQETLTQEACVQKLHVQNWSFNLDKNAENFCELYKYKSDAVTCAVEIAKLEFKRDEDVKSICAPWRSYVKRPQDCILKLNQNGVDYMGHRMELCSSVDYDADKLACIIRMYKEK